MKKLFYILIIFVLFSCEKQQDLQVDNFNGRYSSNNVGNTEFTFIINIEENSGNIIQKDKYDEYIYEVCKIKDNNYSFKHQYLDVLYKGEIIFQRISSDSILLIMYPGCTFILTPTL